MLINAIGMMYGLMTVSVWGVPEGVVLRWEMDQLRRAADVQEVDRIEEEFLSLQIAAGACRFQLVQSRIPDQCYRWVGKLKGQVVPEDKGLMALIKRFDEHCEYVLLQDTLLQIDLEVDEVALSPDCRRRVSEFKRKLRYLEASPEFSTDQTVDWSWSLN